MAKYKELLTQDLCDYPHYPGACKGKCMSYKRFGKSGRDKGRVVEMVVACQNEAHTVAARDTQLEPLQAFDFSEL